MKFNLRALSLTAAILWGGGVLLACLANLLWPGYAEAFLEFLASIYPGYSGAASIGQVAIATLWALVDGFLGGLVFGWLYNRLAL